MKQLAPDVWTHAIDAEGFPTLSAIILTPRLAIVVDTLTGPRDMDPVVEFLAAEAAGRRVAVVNTHHHWDHVFGNAAFPGVDIIAQRACPRLIPAELQGGDESLRLPPSEGVPLPNITFGDRLTYADEGETRAPHPHARPHRGLAGRLPRRQTASCSAATRWSGRCPTSASATAARRGSGRCASSSSCRCDLVVPAHGPAMDKRIIDANERYVAGVYEAVAAAKASGVARGELELPPAALPGGRRRRRRGVRGRSPRQPALGLGRGVGGPPPFAGRPVPRARTTNWTLSSHWCTKGP